MMEAAEIIKSKKLYGKINIISKISNEQRKVTFDIRKRSLN